MWGHFVILQPFLVSKETTIATERRTINMEFVKWVFGIHNFDQFMVVLCTMASFA